MKKVFKKRQRFETPEVVGSRFNPLSILTWSLTGIFIFIILLLLLSDLTYLIEHDWTLGGAWRILSSKKIYASIQMSVVTSFTTLALVVFFSIPIGYGLSRYRFTTHSLVNTIVDIPMILPPVVMGVSLLAFFGSPMGLYLKKRLLEPVGIDLISAVGIVLCQFLISIPYCIRAAKASFDGVDRNLEHVALTLGCTRLQVFQRVTLPLAWNGLLAGAVMAWARAIGVFGPLMVFVGTGPRVQVMPTSVWLELNIGNIEESFTIALIMVLIAGAALLVVHWLVPERKWA